MELSLLNVLTISSCFGLDLIKILSPTESSFINDLEGVDINSYLQFQVDPKMLPPPRKVNHVQTKHNYLLSRSKYIMLKLQNNYLPFSVVSCKYFFLIHFISLSWFMHALFCKFFRWHNENACALSFAVIYYKEPPRP